MPTEQGSELGRALAAMRVPRARQCAVCGREFIGRGRATFCSDTCRSRAYRARRKAAPSPNGRADDRSEARVLRVKFPT